jgi:hypothetical protein
VSGDTFADAFVLAQGLRGRAPHGPPPPRVLDVLVFHRARARFLAAAAEPPAAGALPLPETGFEAASAYTEEVEMPFEDGAVQTPRNGSFVVQARTVVGHREAADSPADVPAKPSAAPPALEPPRETLRYRQPAVPAIAPTAAVRTDAAPPPPVRQPAEELVRAPQPVAEVEGWVPVGTPVHHLAAAPEPPRDTYPFAAPAAPHLQPAARDVARAHDGPAAAPPRLQQPPPAVPPPALVERRPTAAPEKHDALPFVASPTRSAAAVAERVARRVSRREERAEAPPDEPLRPPRIVERVRESDALTPRSLLREVTRDEVVRALAERLRALARDDRFRLGELR